MLTLVLLELVLLLLVVVRETLAVSFVVLVVERRGMYSVNIFSHSWPRPVPRTAHIPNVLAHGRTPANMILRALVLKK